MCIGFIKIATSPSEKYKLIILNNRDEDLDRPTTPIHWHDGMLSGVDEKDVARGTWLGMDAHGKVGMLLSITQPVDSKHKNAPSRGGIVNEYLKSGTDTTKFYENLRENAEKFNGFQFVGVEKNPTTGLFHVQSLTNQLVDQIEISKWNDKFHVFSNSPPHVPFKKTEFGLKMFEEKLKNTDEMSVEQIFEKLFEIATCRTSCFPDDQIRAQTGFPEHIYKPLTSIFVRFPEIRRYGTRSHTLIVVDQNGQVTVLDRRMEPAESVEESTWHDEKITFKLC
ncbi:DUF833-domain-containing protein [Caenorhabditis elegans]|uniref:DUF833-domain-containing protein n=1 Tax=Caenorhabditis elegans TaxID=6239 RepID=Q9U1Q8_CAEEL|nr:DUF833-domain-containing protein [Caenorhabditis elegans]CAB60443.1 DUF833-domain-containing protein [Caenorhabditis elegans]|eukprot:NP_507692.1 Uncharacterized protein CELE_Y80D3A.9 [Caenorhabditis elegans]